MIEYILFSYAAMFILAFFGMYDGMTFSEGLKFFFFSPLSFPLVVIEFLRG